MTLVEFGRYLLDYMQKPKIFQVVTWVAPAKNMRRNILETGYEAFGLCKVNPKFVELIERSVIALERTQMLPRQKWQAEESRRQENVADGLLIVAEAAKQLRISEYTLRGWISQRRIPYVKIGMKPHISG